jgi:hypothetical protein
MRGRIAAAALLCIGTLGVVAVLAHGAGMIRLVGHEGPDDRRVTTRDEIRILAFQPNGPVKPGVETEFAIQIEVDLQSAKEGIVRVGFNLDAPTTFRMIDSRDLHEGKQKVNFAVKAKPVDWADRGYFAVIVNMGPKTTAPEWTPTALAHKTIALRP